MIEYAGDPLLVALALQSGTLDLEKARGPKDAMSVRAALANIVARAALEAYRRGEVDLAKALAAVDRAAAGSGSAARIQIVGEFSIRALEIGRPRSLNRSKPPYPRWVRNLAVDLVLSMRDAAPYLPSPPEKAERERIIDLLDSLGLLPSGLQEPLSERTLHGWCLQRLRSAGKISPRGRPRKKR